MLRSVYRSKGFPESRVLAICRDYDINHFVSFAVLFERSERPMMMLQCSDGGQ